MSDFVVFDVEAQGCLKSGVDKLCKAVSMTMGPRGKLALIERQGKPPHLTKDGATVAKNLFLGDRTEAMGAALLRQASENTAEVAGDGSTTSTVLAAEIYNKASQALQTGVLSPSEMANALQTKCNEVIEHLVSKSRQVNSNDEIKQVATISANGDEYIGDLIAKAMTEVGSSGLVTVEKSKTTSTDLNLVRGIKVDRGYISPYFINSSDKSKCVLEDPFVLIVDNKIQAITQLLPVLEKMHQTKKPVFIIANDFDPEAIQSILANVTKGILEACIIRSPFYGEKRAQILDDLAKTLGTKVISDLDEKNIDAIKISDLGTCKKIEVTREETLFVECKTEEFDKDIVSQIEKRLEDPSLSKEDTAFLKQRLIIIKGVVAVLSIGAHTESELLELVDRIDDALHATKAAIDTGFLPGGGIALARAGIHFLNQESSDLSDQTITKIVADACLSPLRQILLNADLPVDYIMEMIKNNPSWEWGYDVRSAKYVDMIESGIIDPCKVTTTALKNAVSVASSLLSVGCLILESPEAKESQIQYVQLDDDMY